MSFLDALDHHLFTIGKSDITVGTLVELVVSGFLLWLVAGRFSRWTLDKALARSHMEQGQKLAIQGLVHHMRTEQQLIRDWVDSQSDQQREIQKLLEMLVRERVPHR